MQYQPPSQPGWGQPEQQQPYPQQPGQYPQPQYYQQPQTQYPPYPQQQPVYAPQPPFMPPQRPPKKRHTLRNIIIGAVVAVIVIAIIAANAGKGASTSNTNQSTPTPQTTTQVTSQPTSQPTSAPSQAANRIGVPVPSGSWEVTLNSVKTNTGDGAFDVPKTGNVFLVVNATLKNTDSSAQTASTLLQWKVLDSQGQSYQQDIIYGSSSGDSSPEGAVPAGQQLRGDIAFEVPTSIHQFIVQFQPGFDGNQIVQWTVSS